MDMEEIKEFMKGLPWGTLATSDGEKVGVRPMSGLAWKGDELWCATSDSSDKVTQLKKVAYAEYCFCDAQGNHVRIGGSCEISSDNDEKLWLYEAVPALKDYIPDAAVPEYVVIKLKPDNIRFMAGTDMEYIQVER
jgi:general stress protein 26